MLDPFMAEVSWELSRGHALTINASCGPFDVPSKCLCAL
jgi:hypothetical protein